MKTIELSKGQLTQVDDDLFDYLNQWKWYMDTRGYVTRCVRISKTKTKRIFMARLVMENPVGLNIDHIDRNPLNNQRANLRKSTTSENAKNRRSSIDSASKYLGVSKTTTNRKSGKKYVYWRAAIRVNKKSVDLGTYKTQEEAARAYDQAAKLYHKEFANLNFKDENNK